jgi:hypothetical protein
LAKEFDSELCRPYYAAPAMGQVFLQPEELLELLKESKETP